MAIQTQFYHDSFGFSFLDPSMENLCFVPQQHQQFVQFVDDNPQFVPYVDKHRLELQQFLDSQNEQLRSMLDEQRKKHEALLIKKYEAKTRFLLMQKDQEIAKASNRTQELQNFLRNVEMEKQTWQKAAKETESMVASLNGLIQRVRESVCSSENAEDVESSCPSAEEKRNLICKCCNNRNCCVVILPCRHLSSCRDCEVSLDSCPVCRTAKKASIEALL